MHARIEPISTQDAEQAFGLNVDRPVILVGARDDEGLAAVGGLYWHAGRCVIWMDVQRIGKMSAFELIRVGKSMLKKAAQLGETAVWCYRDDTPTSERLLTLIGLKFVGYEQVIKGDGEVHESEVWQCRDLKR